MRHSGIIHKRIIISVIIVVAIVSAIIAAVRVSRQGVNVKGSGLSSEFQFNLPSIAPIDPKLILYEEIGEPIPTGLSKARALAAEPSGMLYVVGDRAVKVIDARGRIADNYTLTVTPRCLALAEERLYIGTQDQVMITDRKGKVHATWPSLGDNAMITSIALNDEYVFIADAGQRVVWCYDREGRFIRRIGDKNPEKNIPGFVIPSPYFDLAMAPDGLLRVGNSGRQRIEAYTVKGDLEFTWGKFGNDLADFTGCCNPVNFAILADGSLVTCEKGLIRVKVYDVNGMLSGVVAGPQHFPYADQSICETPEQCQRGGFDVAVDAAGRVYILDTVKNVVRIFALKESNKS